jgi:carboxyl-terminal processing protease
MGIRFVRWKEQSVNNRFVIIAIGLCVALSSTPQAAPPSDIDHYPDLFEEIVEIVEDNFYNPARTSKDFPAMAERYRERLEQVSSKREFSALVNAMLGELSASHTYYLTPDDYEYYHLGSLFSKIPEIGALFGEGEVMYPTVGIITQAIKGRIYVASVLEGSVAERAGLLKGDEIISVDGNPYMQVASLRLAIGNDVSFEIRRDEGAEPITIVMKPILVNPGREMLEAERASIRLIERNGRKVGYIHIYSYAGEEYHRELLDAVVWGALKDADALIIDLRYGLGGAWPYYLNIFNPGIPVLAAVGRDGDRSVVDSQWRRPAAYLVNGYSRSGKELLAFGAKKYRLATVVGERTAGHVLGGRLFPISNNDLLFLAVQRYLIDGVDLEGVGVAPDVEVPFDIRYCAGRDVQIEKAVDYLLEKLSSGKKMIE